VSRRGRRARREPPPTAEEGNIGRPPPRPNPVELSRDPDLPLIQACQKPESDEFETAFETLYHKYRDRVYSIAYRITGRAVDAMDVVQECFSLLFRRIETFRFDALFSTWLFRIVVNCSIDQVRRQRSWSGEHAGSTLTNLDEVHSEPVDQDPGPGETAEANELGSHVQASIQKMSPKLRAILVLRYLESMSYEELAETMDLSMGTVKSRLARAHLAMERALRGKLDAFGYPEAGGGGVA
jgi:RNA polymerase sigma-70 factor (ECF subfamily)